MVQEQPTKKRTKYIGIVMASSSKRRVDSCPSFSRKRKPVKLLHRRGTQSFKMLQSSPFASPGPHGRLIAKPQGLIQWRDNSLVEAQSKSRHQVIGTIGRHIMYEGNSGLHVTLKNISTAQTRCSEN
ncbi:hypothetical protein Nepgr_020407 [Nepenthes gracilis]|uniref:Uncharacterized protein n=1 Tax=Nepenthes gracilis TaxID=150966 RepID=A0AAD3SX93_NEPGR|nr:hypothetical protein Nepgr_020407 [Nepenthes gracilis]